MSSMHFRISGEFVTQHVRSLCLEDTWDSALKFLLENMMGMTYEIAVGILKGETKLAGIDSIQLEIDNDQEYKQELSWKFSGIWRNGSHGKCYKPYAKVTSWGHEDAHYACRETGAGAPTMFSTHRNRWYRLRSSFYADDPAADVITDGKIADGSEVTVLWKEVQLVPMWVTTHLRHQDALDNFLATGHDLNDRGAHKEYSGQRIAIEHKEEPKEPRKASGDDLLSSLTEQLHGVVKKDVLDGLLSNSQSSLINSKSFDSQNGWILPDGRFFVCKYHEHAKFAIRLWQHLTGETVTDGENIVEKAGWAKVRSGGFVDQQPAIELLNNPTDGQRQSIATWCRHHRLKFNDVVNVLNDTNA